jgi:hypothetical protein
MTMLEKSVSAENLAELKFASPETSENVALSKSAFKEKVAESNFAPPENFS